MEKNNIFIATLPRSGSTLIGMILGAHSQICHIGESAYWEKLDTNTTKCCCGKTGCRTLIKMSKLLSNIQQEIEAIHSACSIVDLMEEPNKIRHSLSLSTNTANPVTLDSLLKDCCNGLCRLTDIARDVSGKNIIVENSKYPSIAEALLDNTSNWKILIITRDPRGVASCNKEAGKRKGVPRPIKDKIDLFLIFAKRALSLSMRNGVLLVRYEDLCRNPIKTITGICNFIGISFEDQMLRFKENKGHLLMGNHMMHDTNEEIQEDTRWRDLLSYEEKCLFMRNDLVLAYEHLGYDLIRDS